MSAAPPDPTACANPTRTLSGGGSDAITVAGGEVLRLSGGTFTGGSDSLPADAVICVGPGATYSPAYLNNPRGALVIDGAAVMGSLSSADGLFVDVRGTLAVNGGLNLNGPSALQIAVGGTVNVASLTSSVGAVITNDGTLTAGQLNLNGSAELTNAGELHVTGDLPVSGDLVNTGSVRVDGAMIVNGSGSLVNRCLITTNGDLAVNARGQNDGIIRLGSGSFRVNGEWSQTLGGFLQGAGLNDDGTITGYGRYQFAGQTRVQGTFVGGSASEPILVHDLTPPAAPKIFDLQTGTIANAVAGTVSVPADDARPAGCSTSSASTADLRLEVTGPASAVVGTGVTYTLVITNGGPSTATGVVVVATVPADLAGVVATGATRSGNTLTWTIPSLAAGVSRTLVISGTAPGSPATLVVSGSASAEEPDAVPADNDGSSPQHTVTTTVTNAAVTNNEPSVLDDSGVTWARTPLPGSVVATDEDVDQALVFAVLTPPSSGTLALSLTGAYTYTPVGDFTGKDTFRVRACDNGTPSLCGSSTVTVTVMPVAHDVAVTTISGQPVDVLPKANDVGDTAAGMTITQPDHGTAAVDGESVRYTPTGGFVGADFFNYRVCSIDGIACTSATVVVLVQAAVNHAPVADPVAVTTIAGTAALGVVVAHDPDAAQTLAYEVGDQGTHGQATVLADGLFSYLPEDGFAGLDSFTVRFCDDAATPACGTAVVTVTVLPLARGDAAFFTAGNPVTIDVLGNDVGAGTGPTIVVAPAGGTAVVEGDGRITYTPGLSTTSDHFTYRTCVPTHPDLCATAIVLVSGSTGSAPVGDPATGNTWAGVPVILPLSFADPDGDAITITVADEPDHGSLSVVDVEDGVAHLRYEPNDATFSGVDDATVQLCDTSARCVIVPVTLTVAPIAVVDALRTTVGQAAGLDPRSNDLGNPGLPTVVDGPEHGSAVIDGAGRLVYTPDDGFAGYDRLTYEVCAAGHDDVCHTATVIVAVAPQASDALVRTGVGVPVLADVMANSLIGDGTVPRIDSGPTAGVAQVRPDGRIAYQPRGSFTGHDTLLFTVCAQGSAMGPRLCSSAVLVVEVAPRLHDDVATTTQERPVRLDITANDAGEAGRPRIMITPAHGTVTVDAGGRAVYTPQRGFVGVDSFQYERCAFSAPAVCSTAVVTIRVTAATSPVEGSSSPGAPGTGGADPATPTGQLAWTGSAAGGWLLLAAVFMAGGAGLLWWRQWRWVLEPRRRASRVKPGE